MRILVTGASGRIGRHLALGLADAGHEVIGLCRHGANVEGLLSRGIHIVFGDTSDKSVLRGSLDGCTAVVHAGCVRSAARVSTYQHFNTQGTICLAEEANHCGVDRLVFVSSIVAQGPSAPTAPHSETGNERPITPYGQSLLACETALRASTLAERITILRPSLVYGVEPSPLNRWIKGVSMGVVPTRTDMNLSLLHIRDLVDAVIQLTERETPCTGTFFLSDGRPVTHADLIDQIERAIGGRPAIRLPIGRTLMGQLAGVLTQIKDASGLFAEQAQFAHHLAGESWSCLPVHAAAGFGFRPKVSFEMGLNEIITNRKQAG